jgi:hypothetical protein
LLFFAGFQVLIDIPEKLPVQEKVDNEQHCEYQTCIVMHRDPLVTGNAKK